MKVFVVVREEYSGDDDGNCTTYTYVDSIWANRNSALEYVKEKNADRGKSAWLPKYLLDIDTEVRK